MVTAASSLLPVRHHHLRAFGRSALHGQASMAGSEEVAGSEEDPTYAMEGGTCLHHIVFNTRKVIAAPMARNDKHKAWQEFQAEHADCEIVTPSVYEKANRMAEAVLTDRLGMSLLGGVKEETFYWRWMNRECRGTPDNREAFITELKGTGDSSPGWFIKHALRMHYHAQLAYYLDGTRLAGKGDPKDAYIVAVEDKIPYAVTAFRLSPRALEVGRKLNHLWMERLLGSEAANAYPPYSQAIVPLDVPEWMEEAMEAVG